MRNIAIGEWGADIVLMYDKNSSCETKRGDRYNPYTITVHNICSLWDGMFIVHDTNPSFAKRLKLADNSAEVIL